MLILSLYKNKNKHVEAEIFDKNGDPLGTVRLYINNNRVFRAGLDFPKEYNIQLKTVDKNEQIQATSKSTKKE